MGLPGICQASAQQVAPGDNQQFYGTDESATELGEQLTHYMFAWVCLLWTCLMDFAHLALNPSSFSKVKFGSNQPDLPLKKPICRSGSNS